MTIRYDHVAEQQDCKKTGDPAGFLRKVTIA